jgi:cytoskeletal protein CcmA (bactofilin family)
MSVFSGNKSANKESVDTGSINLIGNGTTIEGDIKANGDVRIDGLLTGSINTKGKLVVGPSGKIEGEVICQNADISGAINGKVTVSDLLSLKASAKLNGDIVTGKLAIEPGATFTGACSMNGGVVKEINRNAQQANAKTA